MRTGKLGFTELRPLAFVFLGFCCLCLMITVDQLQEASSKQYQITALELQSKLETLARLKCPPEAQKLLALEPLDPGAHPECEHAYLTLIEGDAVPVARCITDDRKFEPGTALCAAPNLSLGAPIAWNVTAALLPQERGH